MKIRENTPTKLKIMAIDDSPMILTFLKQYLSKKYEVLLYSSTSAALKDLSEGLEVSCVLTDYYLGNDLTGLEFLQQYKRIDPIVPVLVLSGSCDTNQKIECLQEGAIDFVTKPFNPLELEVRISKAIASSTTFNVYRYAV